ncbi:MAG: nucleoside hydrolase [Acidaminobacteraceae bacterium]
MKKVILDVDTGIDDALGILLAIISPEIDLMGITTVSGNIDVESSTLNTLRVLKLIDKTDEVGVYMGATKPLSRSIRYATEVHGSTGMADQLLDFDVKYKHIMDAEDFIIKTVKENPGEITIVMTAPETNLARAFAKAPEIEDMIKEVIIMGGVVGGKGNESPVAEFNIAIDPEAAHIVFNGNYDLTMIGLDVTKKALLTEDDIAKITETSRVKKFIGDVTKIYMDRFFLDNGIHGCAIHDPLAVAVAIDSSLVETEHKFIVIERNSEYCDGMTICDFDGRWGKKPNVHVALAVDSERFINFFIDRMSRY